MGMCTDCLQDEKLAEDIVQDTFMKIYQQGQKGYIPDSFKPWMYKIATNSCRDYWRKASTQREYFTDRNVEREGKIHHIIDRQLERQWMIDSLNNCRQIIEWFCIYDFIRIYNMRKLLWRWKFL